MVQKLIKYGNSLAVVLPKEIVEQFGLSADSLLEISRQNGHIAVTPVTTVPALSPEDQKWATETFIKHREVFEKLAKV